MVLGLAFNMLYNQRMKILGSNLLAFLLCIALFSFFVAPTVSLSATNCNPNEGKICDPLGKNTDVPALIETVLEGAITIGIPIVALAVIYCGFLFVSARGNPESITKAKDSLLYTLIGAALLLGSWAIAQLISRTVIELKT